MNYPYSPSRSLRFVLVLLLLSVVKCQATSSNQFLNLTTYPTGGSPNTMVSADFNRDGKADLVILNSNGKLSFLAGTGGGAFSAPKTIAALPWSSANALMAAGDFNGDGNVDVVLLPSPGNTVKVFFGRGDGTFAGPVTVSDGLSSAVVLATGDFNNNDRDDIVVGGATSVSILFGNGNSTFGKPQVTTAGINVAAIALGDVNLDSHLDIAITDGYSEQTLLGSSTGALHPQTVSSGLFGAFPAGANVIVIADFNGDGKPDIAGGDGANPIQYTPPRVYFFNGNGDGTFTFSTTQPQNGITINLPFFSQMLMTNLNGKPGFTFPADPLFLFVNNGTESFTQTSYAVGGPLALADFNGDGRQDIASGNSAGVQVVLNAGGGAVRAPLSLVQAGGPFTFNVGMATADMNRDGYADLILDDYWNEHGINNPSAVVLLGGRRNTFTLSASAGLGFVTGDSTANPPAIGDFNNNGLLDIAYSANVTNPAPPYYGGPDPYIQVLFGGGKGNIVATGPQLSFTSNYLAAGYFKPGGYEDLASVDGSDLSILLGTGHGTFAPPVHYGVGDNPVFVLQRDLNGDGQRDLVVVNHDSDTISILLGNGNGTFKTQKTYPVGKMPNVAVTGDFNRDGKVDIAVGSSEGISVLLGNGNGTFQAGKLYSATGPITGIAEADVLQNGIESLLGVDSTSKRFGFLPGVGNGTFGTPVFYPVDQIPVAIVAGDFDRDGAPDIALLTAIQGYDVPSGQTIGGTIAVYYNQRGDYVSLASTTTKPKPSQHVILTAHVSPSPTEPGTPSGRITFKDETRTLGTVTMTNGAASLSTAFAAGTHHILAEYSGDSNFNPNHSATLMIVSAP